jgi:glycolate oxidase iron-sulfur subunit
MASLPVLDNPASHGAHVTHGAKDAALTLDPRTYDRALSCVHCGLCLPACPTYVVTGHEADSPRGRIQLMRGLADGLIQPSESVQQHLALCLDCRACETACPSGVVYHELIEETRHRMSETVDPSLSGRLIRWMFLNVLTRPTRLKFALLPPRVLQKLGVYNSLRKSGLMKRLPEQFRKMEQMLPSEGRVWPKPLPKHLRAATKPGAPLAPPKRVGFFAGCIGSVMFDEVNRKAVELLAACGADVLVFPQQSCCGAIHHHNGVWEPARAMARKNIDAFARAGALDYVTCTIAGCGSMLHEYDHLLRDDPEYAAKAKAFSSKAKDISEVLLALGLPEMTHRVEQEVTYHEACHLVHAQKVSPGPKKLLASVPGLTLVPLPEADLCCGAAGTYNLTQPEMATTLAERKLKNIELTGTRTCATGNVGCAMHIQSQAEAIGQSLRVVHPVEILHRAVFGRPDPLQR